MRTHLRNPAVLTSTGAPSNRSACGLRKPALAYDVAEFATLLNTAPLTMCAKCAHVLPRFLPQAPSVCDTPRRKLVLIIYADAVDAMTDRNAECAALVRAAATMVERGDVYDVFANLPGTDRNGFPIGVVGFKPATWPQ